MGAGVWVPDYDQWPAQCRGATGGGLEAAAPGLESIQRYAALGQDGRTEGDTGEGLNVHWYALKIEGSRGEIGLRRRVIHAACRAWDSAAG